MVGISTAHLGRVFLSPSGLSYLHANATPHSLRRRAMMSQVQISRDSPERCTAPAPSGTSVPAAAASSFYDIGDEASVQGHSYLGITAKGALDFLCHELGAAQPAFIGL